MATLLVALGVALTLGLAFGLAAGPALVVLVLLAGVVAAGWVAYLLFAGPRPGRVVEDARRAELLGPGGADDPDASR